MRNVLAFGEGRDAGMPLLVKTLPTPSGPAISWPNIMAIFLGSPCWRRRSKRMSLCSSRTLHHPCGCFKAGGGELHLHGWIYAAGVIFVYDPHEEQFVPLTQ